MMALKSYAEQPYERMQTKASCAKESDKCEAGKDERRSVLSGIEPDGLPERIPSEHNDFNATEMGEAWLCGHQFVVCTPYRLLHRACALASGFKRIPRPQ